MSYKYHGDMYDHKGTNMSKIMYKQTKIDMMITKVKAESSPRKIGKAALSVRIMLLEAVITPTVLCSTETEYFWEKIPNCLYAAIPGVLSCNGKVSFEVRNYIGLNSF